jgi:hypothetical protein
LTWKGYDDADDEEGNVEQSLDRKQASVAALSSQFVINYL